MFAYKSRKDQKTADMQSMTPSVQYSSSSFTAPARPAQRRPPAPSLRPTPIAQSSSTLGLGLKLSLLARDAFFATTAAVEVKLDPKPLLYVVDVVDVEDMYDAARVPGW